MKPKYPYSRKSAFLAASLLGHAAMTLPALATNGTWANPALVTTATLTSNVNPGTEADLVWPGQAFEIGDLVQLTGTVPDGFTPNTYYHVVSSDTGTGVIQLSATPGGLAILATSAIVNGTGQAAYKTWQSAASWNGGVIATDIDGIATFSTDFTAPEVVGAGAFTIIGTINFTDTTGPANGGYLTISFIRRKPPTDLTYTVEITGNLQAPPWDSGPTHTTEVPPATSLDALTERVTVRDNIPASGPARFIRLRVGQ